VGKRSLGWVQIQVLATAPKC